MPSLIDKICNNFAEFAQNGIYYEEEVFTKFEDAIIRAYEDAFRNASDAEKKRMRRGTGKGIKIIHGSRSMIEYPSRNPHAKGVCELGDIQMVFVNPNKKEARRVFLQFKVNDYLKRYKVNLISVKDNQAELYLNEYAIPLKYRYIVEPEVEKVWEPNCMFGIIRDKYELQFANLNYLDTYSRTQEYRRFKTDGCVKSSKHVETETTKIEVPYDYCIYADTLKLFLECASKMIVGEDVSSKINVGLCFIDGPDLNTGLNNGPNGNSGPNDIMVPDPNSNADTIEKQNNNKDSDDEEDILAQGVHSTLVLDVTRLKMKMPENVNRETLKDKVNTEKHAR